MQNAYGWYVIITFTVSSYHSSCSSIAAGHIKYRCKILDSSSVRLFTQSGGGFIWNALMTKYIQYNKDINGFILSLSFNF